MSTLKHHFSAGTVEFVPIHFMHRSIPFNELVALYAVSDVCLVSSTRDGMNLVSYEYISAQQNNHGVMILSEFAGAAQSLNGKYILYKKKGPQSVCPFVYSTCSSTT